MNVLMPTHQLMYDLKPSKAGHDK